MATKKRAAPNAPPQQERRKRRTMSQNDMFSHWFENDVLIAQRCIYLGNVFNDATCNESMIDATMLRRFEKAMTALEYFNHKEPILIRASSGGGDAYYSLAIYDRIMDSPCFVTMHATGYVMSGMSIILQAADKRLLSRNATFMMHYGSPGTADNHHVDAERQNDEMRRLRGVVEDIYLGQMQKKNPQATKKDVQELLLFDSYMDAVRTIRLGLADGLVPRTKHRRVRPKTSTGATPPAQSDPE